MGYGWKQCQTIREAIINWIEIISIKGEKEIRNVIQAHYHWKIWKECNKRIFEKKESEAKMILKFICLRDKENIGINAMKIKNVGPILNKLDTIQI